MYSIEKRKVSDGAWWKPWTWGHHHFEFRRVWEMDSPLPDEELDLFIEDGAQHSKWTRDWPVT